MCVMGGGSNGRSERAWTKGLGPPTSRGEGLLLLLAGCRAKGDKEEVFATPYGVNVSQISSLPRLLGQGGHDDGSRSARAHLLVVEEHTHIRGLPGCFRPSESPLPHDPNEVQGLLSNHPCLAA